MNNYAGITAQRRGREAALRAGANLNFQFLAEVGSRWGEGECSPKKNVFNAQGGKLMRFLWHNAKMFFGKIQGCQEGWEQSLHIKHHTLSVKGLDIPSH